MTSDRRDRAAQAAKEFERRNTSKTPLVLAGLTATAVLGVGVWAVLGSSEAPAPGDTAASAVQVQPDVFETATGSGDHRPLEEQIDYDRARPPAAGPHWPNWAPLERKFYTSDRPELEYLVHNLEHGYTILWFDPSVADDEAQLAAVKAYADSMASDYSGKFIAAPWTAEDGDPFPGGAHFALTHWTGTAEEEEQGVWRYFDQFSSEVVDDFMDDYPYTDSPEPDAP